MRFTPRLRIAAYHVATTLPFPGGDVDPVEPPPPDTYITNMDEWTAYLDEIGATAYTDEELIYTEMGYATYDEFLEAIDEGSTITEQAVLAAWTAVAP